MREIIVNKNEAGQRLDKLLQKYLNEASTGFIYKMLRKKNITLNGKKATGNEKVVFNDSVKLFLAEETINKFSSNSFVKVKNNLDIVYEDDNVIFINKKAGDLSQKSKKDDISLNEELISYLLDKKELAPEDLNSFRPSVCNRLDRNTSGLITAGKTLIGLQELSLVFKERCLDKYYRCIVAGELNEHKKINGYLLKNELTNKVMIYDNEVDNSSLIQTEYRPVKVNNGYSLLEIKLITGKPHQIRAHLASIGFPIIGDMKYGNSKINKMMKEEFELEHQLLHSYRLEIPKNTFKGEMDNLNGKVFIADIPEKFEKIINALF